MVGDAEGRDSKGLTQEKGGSQVRDDLWGEVDDATKRRRQGLSQATLHPDHQSRQVCRGTV